MAATRSATARQNPSRAARPTNATEKPKTVVFTTTMFKRPANPARTRSKPTASIKHPPATHTAPSILKKPNHPPRKPRDHPLSVAFTDSSTHYRNTLLSSATASLTSVHQALLHRLGRATDAPRIASIASHTELIKQLALPLDSEALAIAEQMASSSSAAITSKPMQTTMSTLGKLMDDFRRVVAREAQVVSGLEKEYRGVFAQLAQLVGTPQVVSQAGSRERVRGLREEIEVAGREAAARLEREEDEAERERKETMRQILGILHAQL